MKSIHPHRHRQTTAIACLALIVCLWNSPVWAGAGPMPLEAHLDLARDIVCGEIVELELLADDGRGHVHLADATIAISETLKGQAAGKIKVRVIAKVDREYGGAAVLRSHRVGETGIWTIDSEGAVDHSYGLLSLDRKADVQAKLKYLAERKWSEPVEGVQTWAMQVTPEHGRNPVLILAVRNNSNKDINFPVPITTGFVKLTQLTLQGGQTSDVHRFGDEAKRIFCDRLAPGEIRYVHPLYSSIRLPDTMLSKGDTFKVVLSCENTNPLGETRFTGPGSSVRAWCGVLTTEPIEVVITRDKAARKK